MCGSGGGGGVDLKREEDLRNLKSAESVAAINSIFGIDDKDTYNYSNDLIARRAWLEDMLSPLSEDEAKAYLGDGAEQYAMHSPKTGQSSASIPTVYKYQTFFSPGDSDGMNNRYYMTGADAQKYGYSKGFGNKASLAARLRSDLASIPGYTADKYLQDATTNKVAIEQQYADTRQSIMDYFQEDLDRQMDEMQSSMKVDLARRGLGGSQTWINANTDIMGAYDKGLLDAGNRADASIANLKALDDSARLSLIDQIYAGLDSKSALSSASARLKENAETVRSDAFTQSLGNIFGEVGDKYQLAQYTTGVQRAGAPPPVPATGVVVTPDSYTGTVR